MSKLEDPAARAKIIKDLEDAVKNPAMAAAAAANTTAPPPLRAAAKADKLSGAEKVAKWKSESWLFAITQWLSNWILVAMLLILLAWGRYMVDPLSHLIGYQVIVTDITIIDGDTFKAKVYPEGIDARFKLRLIDAPHLQQPHGSRAAETLLDILSNGAERREQQEREVIVHLVAKDEQAGGNLYFCDAVVRDSVYLNTTSVAMALVERGAAWALKGFHSAKRPSLLVQAMDKAKADKVGLWAAETEPQAPWEYERAHRRDAAKPTASQRSQDSIKSSNKKKRGR